MADVNLILICLIAVIMALLSGFFDALIKQMTTGIRDIGYLASLFIYSLFVGIFSGYTGLLNLDMPLSEWPTVLANVGAQYFLFLTAIHTVADYMIAYITKNSPVPQPQGLATPFMRRSEQGRAKLQTLAMIRKP